MYRELYGVAVGVEASVSVGLFATLRKNPKKSWQGPEAVGAEL
jgi:hypothetical protein